MSFTTIEFMFRFLPIFLIVYYVVPTRYKNMILLIGSFVFYAWGQHFYLLLLMLSIVVNYTFGRLIGERRAQRKPLLILGLIYNFGYFSNIPTSLSKTSMPCSRRPTFRFQPFPWSCRWASAFIHSKWFLT